MENWKSVVGYEGFYEVSDLGRVRSVDRYIRQLNNGTYVDVFYKGKILKGKNVKGYITVKLRNNKHKKIHRLVLEAFGDNPDNKPLCNHINGIKSDNRLSNLEWCTAKENSQHALKNGLHKPYINDEARMKSVEACSKKTMCLNNGMVFKSSYEAALWINDTMFSNTKKIKTVAARVRSASNGNRPGCYGLKFKHID